MFDLSVIHTYNNGDVLVSDYIGETAYLSKEEYQNYLNNILINKNKL
jgi:hypothetical protein